MKKLCEITLTVLFSVVAFTVTWALVTKVEPPAWLMHLSLGVGVLISGGAVVGCCYIVAAAICDGVQDWKGRARLRWQ